MEKLKNQILSEFIDYISWLSLFFIVMVIFALVKCAALAALSLMLVYAIGLIYPLRWLCIAAFALYKSLKHTSNERN